MEARNNKRKLVLCVDDDPDDLQILNEALRETNRDFEIIEARNGQDAIELLKQLNQEDVAPCLIILDINMPVLDGKETLKIIRNDPVYTNIPVVVFTTSNNDSDKIFCGRYGAEMITKPVNVESLQKIVQRMLSL